MGLGPQRRQAPLHPRPRRHHQFAVLLAEPVLAVRGHRPRHQDLGPREQEPGRGAETRGCWQRRSSAASVDGLVRRWADALRWLLRQPNPRLAGLHFDTLRRRVTTLFVLSLPAHWNGFDCLSPLKSPRRNEGPIKKRKTRKK